MRDRVPKRSELFICAHNETLSIAAMRIGKTVSQPSRRHRTADENDAMTQMTNFCGGVLPSTASVPPLESRDRFESPAVTLM